MAEMTSAAREAQREYMREWRKKTRSGYAQKIKDTGKKRRKNYRSAEVTALPKRTFNPDAPLQSINHTSYITGESRSAIRAGIKAGRIPHCVRGSGNNATYLVNVPLYLKMLDEESRANMKGARS